MIVKGPQFGTVWEGQQYDQFDPTGLTFSQWMRKWAERTLSLMIRESVTDAVEIGMTKAQVIEICGAEWEESTRVAADRFLHFKNLQTRFQIDENDRVTYILNHTLIAH